MRGDYIYKLHHRLKEDIWLVRLSSNKGLTWETAVGPDNQAVVFYLKEDADAYGESFAWASLGVDES